jgi:hypothetical protein
MTGAPIPQAQVGSLADQTRARFWELQIPMTVLDSPDGQGVDAYGDYGLQIHFPDQTAIDFFLLGYRTAQSQAAPIVVPGLAEGSPNDEGQA